MRAAVFDTPPTRIPSDTFPLVRDHNLTTGAHEMARQIGDLSTLEDDLLTLASAIFALDLIARRGEREKIVRDLHLSIPVVNYHALSYLAEDIAYILYI